ncbi:hypothetical protein ACEQPO_06210 [Bacillus sp. SL00103]
MFEVYGSRLWPFDDIQKQDAVDFYKSYFRCFEVNLSTDVAIDKFCLWLAVSIHRVRKNFTIRRNYTYSMDKENKQLQLKVSMNKSKLGGTRLPNDTGHFWCWH